MILLSKDGIRYTNNYNPDCDDYIDKMVDSFTPYLREEVTLSDDYTLNDLFVLLDKNIDHCNIIFNSELGHYPLEDYIKDIKKETSNEATDVDYLEVYWVCSCDDYESRGYPNWKKTINFYHGFHGWGTWEYNEHSPHPKDFKGGIAIEFTPLAELKNLPLKIREKTSIELDDGKFEDRVLFEGDRYFSVYDFVSAVLYEISFLGSPENRDESLEDLVSTHEETKKRIEDGDTSVFTTLDEVMEDLKNEDKK